MLLPSLGTSSANVALPALAEAFGATFQQIQWVVLAYLLATTTLIVTVGRLGDIAGRRRLLMAGIVLFTAASALCGAAPGFWLLIAARTVQGLGAAVLLALTMAFVGDAVATPGIGRAMGLLGTMSAAGTALGPSLGGFLLASLGWPAIFFVNVPLGAVALVLAQVYLPADLAERRTSDAAPIGSDKLGTSLLALTLAAYALAMTTGHGRFGLINIALLLSAGVGAGLFVLTEARAGLPLIRLTRFRDPVRSASLAMSALVSTVMMATLVAGPFYLARTLGLGAAAVGVVMSVGPVITALVGVPAGRIVDRVGAQTMAVGGLAGMVIGCSALSLAPITLGLAGYVIPIMIVTAGYAVFQAANNTAVMTDVPLDQRGVVSGMLNLSRNLGLITGASVMGAIFAGIGMRGTFAVAAGLVGVALVIAECARPPTLQLTAKWNT
jgi:MFS family permease